MSRSRTLCEQIRFTGNNIMLYVTCIWTITQYKKQDWQDALTAVCYCTVIVLVFNIIMDAIQSWMHADEPVDIRYDVTRMFVCGVVWLITWIVARIEDCWTGGCRAIHPVLPDDDRKTGAAK